MSNEMKIVQKAALGADAIQIGNQNNYYGITPEKASEMALKLFMDNFPKLQDEAKRVAKERAEELCNSIIRNLEKQGKKDFSEFADPDMQFILNKSQQEYARFGTDTLRDLLCKLIINRINYNSDYYMKIILDEAVGIVKSLSVAHLNYLSLIFLCKHVKNQNITSIEALKNHCEYICSSFPIPNNVKECIPFLNMLRLFIISLGNASKVYSKTYGLELDKVEDILPPMMHSIPGDYRLSPIGIVIAIINAQNKINYSLDFKEWIKPI